MDVKKYVVDASVAIKLCKEEEGSEIAREFFALAKEKKIELYAPDIIVYEIANRLKKEFELDEAFKRMKLFINDYLDILTPLFRKGWEWGMSSCGDIDLFLSTSYDEKDLLYAIDIAKKHNFTFYDATYIMLALKLKVKLVTADKPLLSRFSDTAISLQQLKEEI